MAGRNICSYCGKKLEGKFCYGCGDGKTKEIYCSVECLEKPRMALEKVRKNMKWFAAGIAVSVLLMLSSAFLSAGGKESGKLTAGCGMLLLGLTVVLFPYCTPETYAMFGYVKTNRLGRVIGVLVAIFGLWMLFEG